MTYKHNIEKKKHEKTLTANECNRSSLVTESKKKLLNLRVRIFTENRLHSRVNILK